MEHPVLSDLTLLTVVMAIKEFCKMNYDNGYDAIVEAWSDDDIIHFVMKLHIASVDDFIAAYEPVLSHRRDIEAEIF